jgi:hypothetical protein
MLLSVTSPAEQPAEKDLLGHAKCLKCHQIPRALTEKAASGAVAVGMGGVERLRITREHSLTEGNHCGFAPMRVLVA